MSFDCKYKGRNNYCRRLDKECSPGEKGCVLYGKYDMPIKVEHAAKDSNARKKQERKS